MESKEPIATKQRTWQEIFADDDLKGRQVEFFGPDSAVLRGQVSAAKDEYESFILEFEWCARMDRKDGKWRSQDPIKSISTPINESPANMFDGRILFISPFFGFCTLFPKDADNLDRSEVET